MSLILFLLSHIKGSLFCSSLRNVRCSAISHQNHVVGAGKGMNSITMEEPNICGYWMTMRISPEMDERLPFSKGVLRQVSYVLPSFWTLCSEICYQKGLLLARRRVWSASSQSKRRQVSVHCFACYFNQEILLLAMQVDHFMPPMLEKPCV